MSNLAKYLKARIQDMGYQEIKECARDLDIPYELLRKVISADHIPKDKTLSLYAEKLGLEYSELIAIAYRQKAPSQMQHIFSNSSAPGGIPADGTRMAPVMGRAACGPWLESYSGEPDYFEPVELHDPDAFFVTAEGDSMVGGNIPSGSLLLVSPRASVSNGQIVLARREEEEFTVKTYFKKADGTTILQPLNSAYEPILVESGAPLSVMRVTEVRIKL